MKKRKVPEQIEIDQDMLRLIEQFQNFQLKSPKKGCSMKGIVTKRAKRTHRQANSDWEILTKIQNKQLSSA